MIYTRFDLHNCTENASHNIPLCQTNTSNGYNTWLMTFQVSNAMCSLSWAHACWAHAYLPSRDMIPKHLSAKPQITTWHDLILTANKWNPHSIWKNEGLPPLRPRLPCLLSELLRSTEVDKSLSISFEQVVPLAPVTMSEAGLSLPLPAPPHPRSGCLASP